MQIDRFTIQRAHSLNNFRPGGKEYWIVYIHGDEKKPMLFEKLEAALQWIKDLAYPEPVNIPDLKAQIKVAEGTWLQN